MLAFYTLLFYLLTPFILLRLLWRSLKAPAYRQRWRERLGFYPCAYPRQDIWFHAVSVGEAEALFPLLKRLLERNPDLNVLVTTTTPTGSARVTSVFQDRLAHVYLPYDLPWVVRRFLKAFNPRLAVIMETEIWPNLYLACRERSIPLFVINARLSEKSARGYCKIPSLIRPPLAAVSLIAAQSAADAERFLQIGAEAQTVAVFGNMKFDINIDEQTISAGNKLKNTAFAGRYVWITASTHKNEEALLFDAYRRLKTAIPELLLVVVPRHPERFPEVKKLCETQSLAVVTRTSGTACLPATDVYLADTMGELKMLYAAADVAFVGGSLVPVGGHNLLEAAAVGVPVLFGPYMANFKDIAFGVLAHQAGLQCADVDGVVCQIQALYANPETGRELTRQAKTFLLANRGAIEALVQRIEHELAAHA